MKTQVLILFTLLIFAGCDKSDDPKVADDSCLLTVDTDEEATTTYTYNSDKQLTSVKVVNKQDGTTALYNATLDSKGHVVKLVLDPSSTDETSFSSADISYTGDNLTKAKLNYGPDSYLEGTVTFNSANQRTQTVTRLVDTSSELDIASYTTYTYPNGTSFNPSKIETFQGAPGDGGDMVTYNEYTYDDKKTPSSLATQIDGSTTTNNVLTDKYHFNLGTGDEGSTTKTYTYQYNDKGYPTQSSRSGDGPTVTETYTYSDCN